MLNDICPLQGCVCELIHQPTAIRRPSTFCSVKTSFYPLAIVHVSVDHATVVHLPLFQSQYFCVLFFLGGGYQPTIFLLFCRVLFYSPMVTLRSVAARVLVSNVHHKILLKKYPATINLDSRDLFICCHSANRFSMSAKKFSSLLYVECFHTWFPWLNASSWFLSWYLIQESFDITARDVFQMRRSLVVFHSPDK